MDVLTATEIDRRAWAVEQAVAYIGAPPVYRVGAAKDRAMDTRGGFISEPQPPDPAAFLLGLADALLTYLHKPLVEADARLLQAARAYDGTQDAGNLIGLLADALERR